MRVSRMSLVLGALALGGGGCALIDALAFGEDTMPEPVGEGGTAAHGGTGHGGSGGQGGTAAHGGTGGVAFQHVRVLAINPPIMNHGGAVWLEGEFDLDGATAELQGEGGQHPLEFESVHRTVLNVPDGGFTGDLVVHSGGDASSPLPVRFTPFGLGITRFQDHYPQTAYGRGMPVLDQQRSGHTAHALGQHVYVIGGDDETQLSRAWINADSSLSHFTTDGAPSLEEGRSGHMSLRLVQSLFVLGGESGGTALRSVERAGLEDGTSDPGEFTTQSIALNEARLHAALAVVGRYVYVFGGLDADGEHLASIERAAHIPGEPDRLSSFEPVTNVSLATPRARHTVEVIGQHVIVIGGAGPDGPLASLEMFAIQGSAGLLTHDGPRPDLLQARQDHTSILLGGKLYVFGGSANGSELDSVERVPVGSGGTFEQGGAFASLGFTMAQPRAGASSVVAGNDLYLLGGTVDGNETVSISRASLVAEAEPADWTDQGCELDELRADHVVAASPGWLHVLGGARESDGSWVDPEMLAHVSVPADGTLPSAFSSTNPWNPPRRGACVAVLGAEMWVLGGETEAAPSAQIEHGALGTDQIGPFSPPDPLFTLSSPRRNAACVVLKDRLYVIGGHDGTDPVPTVEYVELDAQGTPAGPWLPGDYDLNTARTGHAVAILGNRLHVIGGTGVGDNPIPSDQALETALIGDGGSLGMFVPHSMSPPMGSRAHPATALVGSWLYVLGGAGSGSATFVQRARLLDDGSGAIGDFEGTAVEQYMPRPRERHAAILLSDHLHVLGGYEEGTGGGGGGGGDAYLDTVISAQLTNVTQQ